MNKVNYSNGKIYKLVSPHTTDIYVGSTTSMLSRRKATHKCKYKLWKNGKALNVTSYKLFDLGVDDVDIILIEKFPCADKMELLKRERYWIEKLDCCNKLIPIRSKGEYYQINKKKLIEKNRKYYKDNKEAIAKRGKEYRMKNKEKIKVRRAKRIICECGTDIAQDHKAEHKKSKKHQKLMELISS